MFKLTNSNLSKLSGSQTHSPVSATPYNADDEHSDLELEDEDESSLPFINLPPTAPAPSLLAEVAEPNECKLYMKKK